MRKEGQQQSTIKVSHSDGSYFKFQFAYHGYAMVGELQILIVFPEHFGASIFYVVDIEDVYIDNMRIIYNGEFCEPKAMNHRKRSW